MNISGIVSVAASALLLSQGSAALAAARKTVVVELFTSQGCSSCPPANANLIELSRRPDVLALSYSVTYWDRLGWKDIFGKPEFTERQVVYEPRLGEGGPFTPQMVVNGRTNAVGFDLSEVEALVERAQTRENPTIALGEGKVTVGAGAAPASGADVWIVRYEPHVINVPVARGENTGRTLPHSHVVRDLVRVGAWYGQKATFDVPAGSSALRTAVLVQEPHGGPILSAVTN